MPDLCCNRLPIIERWTRDERQGSCDPVYACSACGRTGWREDFDRAAKELDRRLYLPMVGAPERRPRFSETFRREAVARALRGHESRIAIALDLGITYETLGRWVRAASSTSAPTADPGTRWAGTPRSRGAAQTSSAARTSRR